MQKLKVNKQQRAQSRYKTETEDMDNLFKSLNKLEKQYQSRQMSYNEEMDKKLVEIKKRYKPVNYSALRSFSMTCDTRKAQMQLIQEEHTKREQSRNKDILPLLQSFKRSISKTSENFSKGFFARRKEKVAERVSKMRGYGDYVKKNFLPPIIAKTETNETNIHQTSDHRRERFGKAAVNTTEERIEDYTAAVRTREIGMNYLKEMKEEVKKAEAENRIKVRTKDEGTDRVNYKNYLKELEPLKRNKNKENVGTVGNLINSVKDSAKDQLKVLVTDIDKHIRKTYKNSADRYVQTIKAKLNLLNKLN